ncbi:hypothetical protein GMRT_12487 [Giardia muris]|uniref:Uncharacterized protein n=1 Tax=Giardia muris TaxID=5742 RepID=A0A4Z1SNR8_GIAMU|nr:hypothetical protein GMRT_12487 [Giardia muris]|eukprot:TNJ27442.1 hypothetical protein GMRT_12487 [Giardia muris]
MPEERVGFVRGKTRISQRSLRLHSGVQRVDMKAKRCRTKEIRQKIQAGLDAQDVYESQEIVPLTDVDFLDTSDVMITVTDTKPSTEVTTRLNFVEGLIRSGVNSGIIDPPSNDHLTSVYPFFQLSDSRSNISSCLPTFLPQYIPPSLLLLPTTLLPRGLALVVCSSHRRTADIIQSFRPRSCGMALMSDTLELVNLSALEPGAREACLNSCGGKLELLQKLLWTKPYGTLHALVGTGAVRYLIASQRRACLPCFRTFLERLEVPRVLLILDSMDSGLANLCTTHLSPLFATVLREPLQRLWVTDLPCTHIPFSMTELVSSLQTHNRDRQESRTLVLGSCISSSSDAVILPAEIEEIEAYPRVHPGPTSHRNVLAFRNRLRAFTTENNGPTDSLLVLEPSLNLGPLLIGLGTMPRVCAMYTLDVCVARYNKILTDMLLQGRYLKCLVGALRDDSSTTLDCMELWQTCLGAFGLQDHPLQYHTVEAALKVLSLQPSDLLPAAYTIRVYGSLPFDVHAAKYPVLQGIPFVPAIKEPQRFTTSALAAHSGTSAAAVVRLLSEIHEEEPRLVFKPIPDAELIEVTRVGSQSQPSVQSCLETIAETAARLGSQFLYDIKTYSETLLQAFHTLCKVDLSLPSSPEGDILISSIEQSKKVGIPLCSIYRAAGGSEDWVLTGLTTNM